MSYVEIPEEALVVRVIRTMRTLAPQFASLSFASNREWSRVRMTHHDGFRDPHGIRATPASTHLRAGPLMLTLVWGQPNGFAERPEDEVI